MGGLGWAVEKDEFEDQTPVGPKPFTNIITTLNPNVHRRYKSKPDAIWKII